MTAPTMQVEVVLALPGRCWRRTVDVAVGTAAGVVLRESGLDEVYARQTGHSVERIGVFGRKIDYAYAMQPGERLELYRPLTTDPRQRRRDRVDAQRGGQA